MGPQACLSAAGAELVSQWRLCHCVCVTVATGRSAQAGHGAGGSSERRSERITFHKRGTAEGKGESVTESEVVSRNGFWDLTGFVMGPSLAAGKSVDLGKFVGANLLLCCFWVEPRKKRR